MISASLSAVQNVTADPPTYDRNDEEKIGALLNPATSTSWEDHFIALDSSIQQLVTNFTSDINNITDPVTAETQLRNLVDQYAPQLLDIARNSVSANSFFNPDDRPLYWARLKIEVILQDHPFLLHAPGLTTQLIEKFELHSRGFDSVDFSSSNPAFTAAYSQNSALKKVLLSGYDPFFLHPAKTGNNIFQSNPSGCVALALHNKVIYNNSNFPIGIIQSAVFPVRYFDFDKGIVEDFFDQFITDPAKKAHVIMTMSQGLPFLFEFDRYTTRNRGGGNYLPDNKFDFRPEDSPSISTADSEEWLETKLPLEIVPSLNDSNDPNPIDFGTSLPDYKFYILHKQAFQDISSSYDYQSFKPYEDAIRPNENKTNNQRKLNISNPSLLNTDLNRNTIPSSVPQTSPKLKMIEGSGGNYLSNEIFYRVALLRTRWIKSQIPNIVTLPTGHFHLPLMQFRQGEDFYPDLTQAVIDIVQERIKRAVLTL